MQKCFLFWLVCLQVVCKACWLKSGKSPVKVQSKSGQSPQKKKLSFSVKFQSFSTQSLLKVHRSLAGHAILVIFLTWPDIDQKMTRQWLDNDWTPVISTGVRWTSTGLVDFHWTSGVRLDNVGDCKLHKKTYLEFETWCISSSLATCRLTLFLTLCHPHHYG